MTARIYRPAKNATQSGMGKTRLWRLDYTPESARSIEPLMGWTSSSDMKSQIRLDFETREEAIAYAERNGIPYRVEEPQDIKRRAMSYADNFRSSRATPWTH
jgi:NADH dehydrogenase ubiquinone Fe-S protein 4